jgi:hypothetical protein
MMPPRLPYREAEPSKRRRWLALLAGPVAVIAIAVAGAVWRPTIWEKKSTSPPVTFAERWRDRVAVPLAEAGIPAWWRADDRAFAPVYELRPGMPFPVPVKTIPIRE